MTKINITDQQKESINKLIHLAFTEIFDEPLKILCIDYSNEEQSIMVKCNMHGLEVDILFCTYAEIYADLDLGPPL